MEYRRYHTAHMATETPEEKQKRLESQKLSRQARSDKLERTRHGGAKSDVELANGFREIGVDFLSTPRDQVFQVAKQQLEGKRIMSVSEQGLAFLEENFDFVAVKDEYGTKLFHFTQGEDEDMNLFTVVAEKSGQKRKIVKEVYEALTETIYEGLKEDRRVRLPGIAIVRIKYRPATEKRKGTNPFNGQPMTFKAKAAANKVKINPVKDLRVFVDKKIEVVAPKKKKSKK
jgi:DNA-binding protein HU-beta